jgi:hypothetical protein
MFAWKNQKRNPKIKFMNTSLVYSPSTTIALLHIYTNCPSMITRYKEKNITFISPHEVIIDFDYPFINVSNRALVGGAERCLFPWTMDVNIVDIGKLRSTKSFPAKILNDGFINRISKHLIIFPYKLAITSSIPLIIDEADVIGVKTSVKRIPCMQKGIGDKSYGMVSGGLENFLKEGHLSAESGKYFFRRMPNGTMLLRIQA